MTEYEIHVDNAPDRDGDYTARVYIDNKLVDVVCRQDRAEAIARAKEIVTWRRDRDASQEVILV